MDSSCDEYYLLLCPFPKIVWKIKWKKVTRRARKADTRDWYVGGR
jgi:hypothetical protein